jgi:hypothetical protein
LKKPHATPNQTRPDHKCKQVTPKQYVIRGYQVQLHLGEITLERKQRNNSIYGLEQQEDKATLNRTGGEKVKVNRAKQQCARRFRGIGS